MLDDCLTMNYRLDSSKPRSELFMQTHNFGGEGLVIDPVPFQNFVQSSLELALLGQVLLLGLAELTK